MCGKTLQEVLESGVDNWVEAIGNVSDDAYLMGKVFEEADDSEVISWVRCCRCPAELERPINVVVEKEKVRFDKDLKPFRLVD